jgi:hypothetical protein
MMKYIALSFVSGLMMQTAVLADEVKSSTTEIQEGGRAASSSSVSTKSDLGRSQTNFTKTKVSEPAASIESKRSDSYSNDGVVEQKETKSETNINP